MALGALFEIRYKSPRGVPEWYSPKLVAKKIKNITNDIIRQHRRDINNKYPPASLPGRFPHKRTGNLKKSVSSRPIAITERAFNKARDLKVKLGYDEKFLKKKSGYHAYWYYLTYGAFGPGKRVLKPRKMLDATARKQIFVSLKKSNPEPWTTMAEWRPLTFRSLK